MKGVELEIKSWDLFDQVLNINAYGSLWGFFSRQYNVSTPIMKIGQTGEGIVEDTIVESVYLSLKSDLDKDVNELYLLGHSMGGIVWRAMIKVIIGPNQDNWLWEEHSPRVRALIQLASPNQGSKLTNMRIVSAVDKIQSAIFLKLSGYPTRLAKSIADRFGILEDWLPEVDDKEDIKTQIQQMRPGSEFLSWLNSDPTYVNQISHYVLVGTRNRLFFTNLAWIESPDEIEEEQLVDVIREQFPEESVEDIVNSIELPDYSEDTDLKDIITNLEVSLGDLEIDVEDDRSEILKMFDPRASEPNDGLVSINDAYLEGAHMVDLGGEGEKITHWGICMWYLPFRPYETVKEKVKSILEEEIGSSIRTAPEAK